MSGLTERETETWASPVPFIMWYNLQCCDTAKGPSPNARSWYWIAQPLKLWKTSFFSLSFVQSTVFYDNRKKKVKHLVTLLVSTNKLWSLFLEGIQDNWLTWNEEGKKWTGRICTVISILTTICSLLIMGSKSLLWEIRDLVYHFEESESPLI